MLPNMRVYEFEGRRRGQNFTSASTQKLRNFADRGQRHAPQAEVTEKDVSLRPYYTEAAAAAVMGQHQRRENRSDEPARGRTERERYHDDDAVFSMTVPMFRKRR